MAVREGEGMGFFWRLFDRRKQQTPVLIDRRSTRVSTEEAQERFDSAVDDFGKAVSLILEQRNKKHVQSK